MAIHRSTLLDPQPARSFDVICAGEALVQVAAEASAPRDDDRALRLRPGGGAVNAALALAREGLRVGLATVLADDRSGRCLRDEIAGVGIDVDGVDLAQPESGLVLVTGSGGARQVVSYREEERPVSVPEAWSARVLLLSGMSPIVAHGAALCKAARAARRQGTVVVVDLNARWELWKGRDPRAIRMVLREADVVWASAADLFGLNFDLRSVRAAMRETAVLATSDGAGNAFASGPFGEVAHRDADGRLLPNPTSGAFVAALCAVLAGGGRSSGIGESGSAMWKRALERGTAAANGR